MAEVDGAKAVSVAFRIAALGLSVAAAVVMGTASQLLADSGGRVVSYTDYGALVYFVVASVISAICAALALYLSVHDGADAGAGSLTVSLLDTAAQALLFSAGGAALAVRSVVAGGAVVFCGKVGTAAALGGCAAAAVSVTEVTKDAARGSFTVSFRGAGGSAAGGSACKHGC